jgi:hypothetical protein
MIVRHPSVFVLAALVFGLSRPAAAEPPNPWHLHPPAADTRRTTFRGATVNQRTVEMIQRAERLMSDFGHPDFQFVITQGSYSRSVSASAGTHAGGGAVDLRTRGHERATVDDMVRALRMAGFAAWSRGRGHDSFPPHIHAIAIGDPELSSGALSQVASYAQGRDGLRGQAPDPDGGLGRAAPLWAFHLLGWELPPPPAPKKPAKKEPVRKKLATKKPARKTPRRRGMIGRFCPR